MRTSTLSLMMFATAVALATCSAADVFGGEIGDQLRWRAAPAAAPLPLRPSPRPALTLEEIVAQAERPPGDLQTGTTPAAVVERELVPLPYREIIRRYLELIRAENERP